MNEEKYLCSYDNMKELYNDLQEKAGKIVLLYDEEALYYNEYLYELLNKIREKFVSITVISICKYDMNKKVDEITILCAENDINSIFVLGTDRVLDMAQFVRFEIHYFQMIHSYRLGSKEEIYIKDISIYMYRTEEIVVILH